MCKRNRPPPPNTYTHTHTHTGRPSLKELCPEDKRRVRLLIEQLARTSSEKEAMEDQVKEERREFTLLLDKLKKQHHKVVKEKNDILFIIVHVLLSISPCLEMSLQLN